MLGSGIAKGMLETARNFVGSYTDDDRLTTVEYPEERIRSQGGDEGSFHFSSFDGDDWQKGLRCVACQICEKECPPQCIYIVKSKDKRPDYKGQPQLYPASFDIDISVCMSCQICVEVCPFESIKMDTEFELSNTGSLRGIAPAQGQAREVERALSQDSSDGRRRVGRRDGRRESQGRGQGRKPTQRRRPSC